MKQDEKIYDVGSPYQLAEKPAPGGPQKINPLPEGERPDP